MLMNTQTAILCTQQALKTVFQGVLGNIHWCCYFLNIYFYFLIIGMWVYLYVNVYK